MADSDTSTATIPLLTMGSRSRAKAGPYAPARSVTAADAHRLMLHVALTAAGVPPAPEDLRTIRQLAEMDEAAVMTVVRWLEHAAHSPVSGNISDGFPAGETYETGETAEGGERGCGDDLVGDWGYEAGDGRVRREEPGDISARLPSAGVSAGTGLEAGLATCPGMSVEAGAGSAPLPGPAVTVDPRLMSW